MASGEARRPRSCERETPKARAEAERPERFGSPGGRKGEEGGFSNWSGWRRRSRGMVVGASIGPRAPPDSDPR